MLCGQGAEEECVEDAQEAADEVEVEKTAMGTLETMKQVAKEPKKHPFSSVTKKISASERMFVNQQSV